MADKKISALTAASALVGTEVFPVVQSGVTKKATLNQVATLIGSVISFSDTLAVGNATSGNDIILTLNDQIKSSVANKSRISFGVNGDEFLFFNDGATEGDAHIVVSNANAIIGNTHGEFSASSVETYLWSASGPINLYIGTNIPIAISSTEIKLDSPVVRVFQNKLYGSDVTKSLIDFGAAGDEVNITTDNGGFNEAFLKLRAGLPNASLGYGSNGISFSDINGAIGISNNGDFTISVADGSDSSQIIWDAQSIVVQSAYASFAGLQYDIDYSSNFTSLSLIDKAYLESRLTGLETGFFWKDAVRAATTVAGTLATDYENGDTVDGVVLVTGDRILIKDQATQADNGIYVVGASGAPTRANDFDSGADNLAGATVAVQEGATNADTRWVCSTDNPITIGVTNITFVSGGGTTYTAGAGLTLVGSQFSISAAAITNAMLAGSIAYSKLSLTGAVVDGDLATSYIKADGTRALTGNWGAGAFSATHNSVVVGSAANQIDGGSASGGNFQIRSTSHATKGITSIDSALNVDGVNNVIGVGTAAVIHQPLTSTESFNGGVSAVISNTSTGTAALVSFRANNSSGNGVIMSKYGTLFTTSGLLAASLNRLSSSTGDMLLNPTGASTSVIIACGGTAAANESFRSGTTGSKFSIGIDNNGSGFKHARITTGSVAGGSTVLVTITWSTAFADSNYTVTAQVEEATTSSLSMSVVHIESKTAAAVTVRVLNNSVGALTGTVHAIAIHD
jgi:hypothetical protein